MSYVLDALRRAEADRQRGQVPGVHAPADTVPLPTRPLAAPGRVHGMPALVAVASSVALAAVLALGLWWWRDGAPAAQPAVDRARTMPLAPSATEPPPSTLGPITAPVPLPVPPSVPTPVPTPVPQPVALPERAAASRQPADAAARRPTAAAPPAAALPAPALGGTDPPRPPLIFGGALDSPDPRARMVVINGQVWREGDAPAPGWVLERIGLHSARFRVQDRTVEVDYGPPVSTR